MEPPQQGQGSTRPEWQSHVALWLCSRILVVCTTYVAVSRVEDEGLATWERVLRVFTHRWDAEYYLRIAEQGYPGVLPSLDVMTHHWAFYPLFAWAIRLLHVVTTVSLPWCAVLLNAALGMLAVVMLGQWFLRYLPPQRTLWAVAFFCFWTQSYFFTYAYGEALYMVLICSMLLLLDGEVDLPGPWHGALAWALGVLGGLTRPYAAFVALALFLGALWRLPRQGFLQAAWRNKRVWACLWCGMGSGLSLLFVWWGNCWWHTGVVENCTVRAWQVGWAYGQSTLPEALARDLFDLWTRRPVMFWHFVMGWEVTAWVLCVVALVASFRLIPRMGVTPTVLATLPLLVNTALPHIDAVPRYMATTPTLFLLLSQSFESPVRRTVLMVGILALHIASATATAQGVWQSF